MVVEIPRWTNAKLEVRRMIRDGVVCIDAKAQLSLFGMYRLARRMLTTPSSKTPRRASFVSSATASPTRVISGTMVLSPRYA